MRLTTILLGYAVAGISGTLAYLAGIDWRDGASILGLPEALLVFLPIVMMVAAPFALVTIAATELLKLGSWWVFILAGVVSVSVLFALVGSEFDLGLFAHLLVISTVAGMTYWYIAWVKFPPEEKTSLAAGEQE